MIKLSRSEDYAVVLVDALSKSYGRQHIPLSHIATEYRLSLLFLRNVANTLRHAGVISAIEGKNGGYTLAKHPNDTHMGEVLQLFHEEEALACCGLGKINGVCHKTGGCAPSMIIRKLNKEFIEKISKLSLTEFQQYAK